MDERHGRTQDKSLGIESSERKSPEHKPSVNKSLMDKSSGNKFAEGTSTERPECKALRELRELREVRERNERGDILEGVRLNGPDVSCQMVFWKGALDWLRCLDDDG